MDGWIDLYMMRAEWFGMYVRVCMYVCVKVCACVSVWVD